METIEKLDKREKLYKIEKLDKVEKLDKIKKLDKIDKFDKINRLDKINRFIFLKVMDWLGSSEVIHVGIGCKVLSLILNEDKVIGFWPFLLLPMFI